MGRKLPQSSRCDAFYAPGRELTTTELEEKSRQPFKADAMRWTFGITP